jgi:hypothetical protein
MPSDCRWDDKKCQQNNTNEDEWAIRCSHKLKRIFKVNIEKNPNNE